MFPSLRFFFIFLIVWVQKAAFSAGARLWGFAESLPFNGEHLLPRVLVLAAETCVCAGTVQGGGGGGGGGISGIKQAAPEIKTVFYGLWCYPSAVTPLLS